MAEEKKRPASLQKHIVLCPHCGKEALDHMTRCPSCGGELTPRGYDPRSGEKLQPVRKALLIVFGIAAAAVVIWLLAGRFGG